MAARPGQQVQRAELVHAEHDRRVPATGFGLAVSDLVELENPVLLGLEVRVVRLLPSLDHLKRHALLSEQNPQALMADVVDHPLSDEEVRQLGQAPRRERQVVILRSSQRDLLDLAALRQGERRRPATGVLRVQRVEAVIVEVVDHLTDPVRRGERHLRDLSDVHSLRREQHHLRSPPRHHRPRRPAHDPEQPIALVVVDLSDKQLLAHPPIKTDRQPGVVDATPERWLLRH